MVNDHKFTKKMGIWKLPPCHRFWRDEKFHVRRKDRPVTRWLKKTEKPNGCLKTPECEWIQIVRFQLERFIAAEFLPSSCTSSCFLQKIKKQRGLLKLQLTIQTSQMVKLTMSWQACDTFDRRGVTRCSFTSESFVRGFYPSTWVETMWKQSVSESWGYFFCSFQMKNYTSWYRYIHPVCFSWCVFFVVYIYIYIITRLGSKEQIEAAPGWNQRPWDLPPLARSRGGL